MIYGGSDKCDYVRKTRRLLPDHSDTIRMSVAVQLRLDMI